MNLKDRMSSGSETQKIAESEIAPKSPNLNTWKDTMQKSNQQSLDSLVEVQAEVIREQKDAIQQKDEKIEALENQIQILSSEKQKLTSVLVETREELSSTQKQNLEIAKENDDLRNRGGLKSRKEQQRLVADLASSQNLLSETRKLVDISNVEAVQKAQAAQVAAELKAKKEISDYKEIADSKIADAISGKNIAIRQAKQKVQIAREHEKIAWMSFIITLCCCLIVHPAFLCDIYQFITEPIIRFLGAVNNYTRWFKKPYYSRYVNGTEMHYAFSSGWAWVFRIITPFLITAIIIGFFFGVYKIWLFYRKRWCNLSLKVLLITLTCEIVFGEGIRGYMSINLITLFLIIQVIYMGILIYLDGYFDSHNKSDYWKCIQYQKLFLHR